MGTGSELTAVVTGAARGIGRASALELARRGFSVAVVDRIADRLEETAAEVRALGVEALSIPLDVSDYAAVQKAGAAVLEEWGHVDVLVNNAGISQPKGLLEISEAEWDMTQAINLKGYFAWCKALAPSMMAREAGRIVNISSISAKNGAGPNAVSKFAYCAAKAGVIGLTRGLAKELAPHVTVNAICPGPIETDLTNAKFAPIRERMIRGTPLKRLGTPEDIAVAVAFFATVTPNFITGEDLDVDGGTF